METDVVNKLKNRQLARLLTHLEQTGQLTVELEKTLKRSFRYTFEDVEALVKRLGLGEENKDGTTN